MYRLLAFRPEARLRWPPSRGGGLRRSGSSGANAYGSSTPRDDLAPGLMDRKPATDIEAPRPKTRRTEQQPVAADDGAGHAREEPAAKRMRRTSTEDDASLKRRVKSTQPTTSADAPTMSRKKTRKAADAPAAAGDDAAMTSKAGKASQASRAKRHRRSSPSRPVSASGKSPKRRCHSRSHRHSASMDGLEKLLGSLHGLCAPPHSTRSGRGALKRTVSSVSSHAEKTGIKRRSSSISSATSALTRRQAKRLCRAVKHALSAAAGTSKKRSAGPSTSHSGESIRKVRRAKALKAASNSTGPFRHGRPAKFRPRRRIPAIICVRVRPCCCRLKLFMRPWKKSK